MVVFAVFGVTPNVTGLLHEVPAEDPAVEDTANPLSVAIRLLGNMVREPTSA